MASRIFECYNTANQECIAVRLNANSEGQFIVEGLRQAIAELHFLPKLADIKIFLQKDALESDALRSGALPDDARSICFTLPNVDGPTVPLWQPETIEAHEQQESAKYEGGGRFSFLYYPQTFKTYMPQSQRGPCLLPSYDPKCWGCGRKSATPMRFIEGDRYFCVPCLKLRGFCGPHGREVIFPKEILQHIFCFLPHWVDLAHCAAASHRWLDAANFDLNCENDLMSVKRFLLCKEVCYQEDRRPGHPLVTAFCRRHQLGCMIGEWPAATARRRLALARCIVESPCYKMIVNHTSDYNNDAFDEEGGRAVRMRNKDLCVEAPCAAHPDHYRVKIDKPSEKGSVVLILDASNGGVLWYEDNRKGLCSFMPSCAML